MLFLELEPIITQSNKNHMNDFMIMLFTFFFFQLSKITEQKELADRGNYVINIMFWPNKYKMYRLVEPDRMYVPFLYS